MRQRRSEERRARRQARLVARLGAPAVAVLVARARAGRPLVAGQPGHHHHQHRRAHDHRRPSGTPVTALLQTVGVFSQAGYDQVVFQFSNALPQYTVQVVSPPLSADPSGKPITIAGSVVVQVTMTPASGFDQTPPGTQVYTGPTDITFNGASVMQVVERGDFEGVLSWYIGLRQPVPTADHHGLGSEPHRHRLRPPAGVALIRSDLHRLRGAEPAAPVSACGSR